jgi:hypothetical protein
VTARRAATPRAITRAAVRALCALGALLSACQTDAGGRERIAAGDPQVFESYLQPYLEARCASLDCHGAAGRALRLYSELGLRREPTLRSRPVTDGAEPQPITPAELDDNQLALAAIAAGESTPDAQLALRKPLALAAGGIAHEGGVHWEDRRAPGYLCLRGYLVGDGQGDVANLCARALDAAMPP